MRIAIFGGTGAVGAPLSEWLAARGHEVTVVSRRAASTPPAGIRTLVWNPDDRAGAWRGELRGADAVVHLARPPFLSPAPPAARRALKAERLRLVRTIVSAVRAVEPRPAVFVCGSSHDVYGRRDAAERLDESAAQGRDFFSALHGAIEREATTLQACGVRVVLARLGVVMGTAGNDPRTLPHVVADPAGPLSWIHITDAVRMIEFALADDGLSGPVNMTVPEPASAMRLRDEAAGSRAERRATLRRTLLSAGPLRGTPGNAVAPVDVAATAAEVDGVGAHGRGDVGETGDPEPRGDRDGTYVRSESHWAYPAKLLEAGYHFRVTSIADAVGHVSRQDRPPGLAVGVRRTARVARDGCLSWTELGSGYPLVVCSPAALPYEVWGGLLGALAPRYRTVFLHPRGLWGAYLPSAPDGMSVTAHAGDLACLVDHLGLSEYGVIGHCAGVPAIIEGLGRVAVRPRRALFVSSRLSQGSAEGNAEKVAGLVRSDAQFRSRYARVAAAYAPSDLRGRLEQELADAERLVAHTYAVRSVREYTFDDTWPDDVLAMFAWANADAAPVGASMRAYAKRIGRACRWTDEFDGDHFTFLKDPVVGLRIVEAAFGDVARNRAGSD